MPQPRARSQPPPPRRGRSSGGGSDLGARVMVAVPAIAFAIALVTIGGSVFLVGLIALGLVCLHELFAMFDRAHPARLAGALGLIGLLVAAHLGDRETVLLAFAGCVPLTFVVVANQAGGG